MSVHRHENCTTGCHGMCCLQLDHVGVTAGDADLISNVSFHLHCGEIVALIGPNGAGKSTLFKTILGQLPHSGTIHFQRSDGKESRPVIGYVPQSPVFDRGDPVSVLDFFAAAIADWPVFLPIPKKLRERVQECLSRTHTEALMEKRIGALSGGELQRVLMALALEPIPQILILDEPLSGVDVEGEQKLLDMLDELRRKYDLSILLSTHDFATLADYADEVILLKNTVLMVGQPQDVLTSYQFRDVFHLRKEANP